MLVHDAVTDEYFVRRWFRHNPPTNPKHAHGVLRLIEALESETVQDAARAELDDGSPQSETTGSAPKTHLLKTRYMNGRG